MRGALFALMLAACSSAPQDLPPPALPQRAGVDPLAAMRAEGVRYFALGEGQFVLRLYDDRISLARTGGDDLSFPSSEPIYPRWSGEIYESEANGHRLRVEIRHYDECEDGRDTVTVMIDGAELNGCGRAL
jgi:hypothetical protein